MLLLQLGPIGAAREGARYHPLREGARYHPLREGARNGRVHVEQRAVVLESRLEVRRFPGVRECAGTGLCEASAWEGGAYVRKLGKLVSVAS